MPFLKTSDLEGAALDWAVATAQGRKEIKIFAATRPSDKGRIDVRFNPDPRAATARFDPSSDWSFAGPIIEKAGILCGPSPFPHGKFAACIGNEWDTGEWTQTGETLHEAAMRCFVASKLGLEVDIPESLAKHYTKPSAGGPSM